MRHDGAGNLRMGWVDAIAQGLRPRKIGAEVIADSSLGQPA